MSTSEVVCYYPWSEKKARDLLSWVKADEQRYALFLDDNPSQVVFSTPHPRIRFVPITQQHDSFERIAWEFLYLPFRYDEPTHPIAQTLEEVRQEIHFRAYEFADGGEQLLLNERSNLSHPFHLGQELVGRFAGRTAIVCGGAPSLSLLKDVGQHAVIIGCGAGVPALLKMGIEPHFAAHIDPAPLHRFSETNIPLLFQLRTNRSVVECHRGARFLFPGNGNFPLENSIHQKLGIDEVMDGGWTVGTFGVKIAQLLGCTTIVLAGIDLAVTAGELYAPGVKTGATTDHFVPMKDREGRSVISRPDWVLAAQWLELFAQRHPEIKFGTLSSRSLPIPSIPVVQLTTETTLPLASLDPKSAAVDGKPVWNEIAQSAGQCHRLLREMLHVMSEIFPRDPLLDPTLALLDHDLTEQMAYHNVLSPLWGYWQPVVQRHHHPEEAELFLHRLLFFQSICEKLGELPN